MLPCYAIFVACKQVLNLLYLLSHGQSNPETVIVVKPSLELSAFLFDFRKGIGDEELLGLQRMSQVMDDLKDEDLLVLIFLAEQTQ